MPKPQVTLTFAGDSTKLESTFNSVGSSARKMEGEVGAASRAVGESATSGFDAAGEAADGAEGKAQGFADVLTGGQDVMAGFKQYAEGDMVGGLATLGAGFASIAGGVASFVIPAIKALSVESLKNTAATVKNTAANAGQKTAMLVGAGATNVMAVAQRGLNLVLRANPIGLVITALTLLVGGIVIAYKRSETFRSVVQGAMRGVQTAFGWVTEAGGKVISWFQSSPGKIGGAIKGLASIITAPYRAAFSGIRSAWNNTVGGKGFSIPDWIPGLGGRDFRIPYFHTGGIVPGSAGSETLAILRAGERVTASNGSGGGGAVTFVIQPGGSALDQLFVDWLKKAVRVRGGNVQVVLGS